MSNFAGYLFKAVKNNIKFPSKYIELKSYRATPNQREEIKAYRSDNSRNLHRVTAEGKKTKISFTTLPLCLDEKIEIQNFFTQNEVDAKERKIELEYWNDEENIYKTGFFYRNNIEYTINSIEDDDIIYEPIEIILVEY